MTKISALFYSLALLSLSVSAAAQDSQAKRTTFVSFGNSMGGDVLVSGKYTTSGKDFTLRAGQGLQAMLGLQYQWSNTWSAQAAVGFHFDKTNGSNFNFKYSRIPLEAMVHYAINDDWRVGAGVRYALSAKFKSDGDAAYLGTSKLQASPGGIAEVQYMLAPLSESGPGRGASGGVSLKLVDESFKVKGASTVERSGQHWALSLFSYF
jgi:hypothetical protein